MFIKPRGTQDIIYPKSLIYWKIYFLLTACLNKEGYLPIITPIFEYEDYFINSLGLESEIILKEIYRFQDKKGRRLALRPEGTSVVLRAVEENKLINKFFPLKLYYWGSMFRYERPQKNRYREFTQLGVEILNSSGLMSDFSLLNLCYNLLLKLGLKESVLEINFIGKEKSKSNYLFFLKEFFFKNFDLFCENCKKNQNESNFIFLTDCIICSKIDNFPKYKDTLEKSDKIYFSSLINLLKDESINFFVNDNLVRGLNYYTGIIFECNLGEDKSVLGGGRYDSLYGKLFNLNYSSLGFAFGIDRLASYLMKKKNELFFKDFERKVDIFFIVLDISFYKKVIVWKKKFEKKNIIIEYNLDLFENFKFKEKKIIKEIVNFYNPKLLFILEKNIRLKNFLKKNWYFVNENELLNKSFEELKI